jgi:hypothetical protein
VLHLPIVVNISHFAIPTKSDFIISLVLDSPKFVCRQIFNSFATNSPNASLDKSWVTTASLYIFMVSINRICLVVVSLLT